MKNMIKRVYLKIRNVLFNKRKIPSELSRWYFLLAILLLTLITVLFFYRSMKSENIPLYRQVHLDIIESAHKGIGYVGMNLNIVGGKGNEKQTSQNPINVDMGILPIPYNAIAEITNIFGPEKEEIVDTITLVVNSCGKEVSFVNQDYNIESIEGEVTVKWLYRTGPYYNSSGKSDSSFGAQWKLCNGIHTSKPQRIHVGVCGDDLFYPQSKHPADFNLFLVINGTYKLQDTLFYDTSHIVLNFDQSSWTFDNIYPKPTAVSPSQVAYIGKEAVQRVFDNHGIYLQAKNESIRTQNKRLQYTYTIMISALLAFLFDILVRLVVLWRNGYLRSLND